MHFWRIFGRAKYGGVEFGVPEKILKNAVQTRGSLVNKALQSKVTIIFFLQNLQTGKEQCVLNMFFKNDDIVAW